MSDPHNSIAGRSSPSSLSAIVGLTRFSVNPAAIVKPGLGIRPLADLRSAVYDDARLRERFQLFMAFTLPSLALASQRFPRFRHIVLASPDLPSPYLDLLKRIAEQYCDWLRVITLETGELLTDACRRGISAVIDRKGLVFNFRIDDDDAIRPEFVDRVIGLSAQAAVANKVVSFDLGYYVQRLSGSSYRVHFREYPKIAIGLGSFCDSDAPASIFDQAVHHAIAPELVINIRDDVYWLRTLHAHNDSGVRAERQPTMTLAEACDMLASKFSYLDLETALAALPESNASGRDKSALRALYAIQ